MQLYDEKDLDRMTKTSRVLRWRLRRLGKLGFCVIGGRIRYTEQHIKDLIERCERPTKAKEKELKGGGHE